MQEQKIPVTARALIQRINRVLAKRDEKLLKARSVWDQRNLGEYYLLDTLSNVIVCHHIDLVRFCVDERVLKPYEYPVHAGDDDMPAVITEEPEEKERSIRKLQDVIRRIEALEREISLLRTPPGQRES